MCSLRVARNLDIPPLKTGTFKKLCLLNTQKNDYSQSTLKIA